MRIDRVKFNCRANTSGYDAETSDRAVWSIQMRGWSSMAYHNIFSYRIVLERAYRGIQVFCSGGVNFAITL